jgi:hypothetical protein
MARNPNGSDETQFNVHELRFDPWFVTKIEMFLHNYSAKI